MRALSAAPDLTGPTRDAIAEEGVPRAALELTAAGERDDAMAGLTRYSTGEASLAAAGLFGPAQAEWLDRVRDDLETYRDVLTWLIERGRPAEAAEREARARLGPGRWAQAYAVGAGPLSTRC